MKGEQNDADTVPLESAQSVALSSGLNPRRAKICMLILTQSCNLNCTYCYEHFKTAKKMNLETACRGISEQLEVIRTGPDYDWLLVDLFGGEPLLNFELIRDLVEWTKKTVKDITVHFAISSNGTLLTDSIMEWLRQNKDSVFYGVSYDGSAEAQLRNRGKDNSEAVRFSRETWPLQPFRMTISPESVSTLASDILSALRGGFRIRAELAGAVHWPTESAGILLREARKLKEAFVSDASLTPTLINRFFKGGEDSPVCTPVVCGSGTRCTCYDTDGEKYACQMFSPVTVGPAAIRLADFDLLDEEKLGSDPDCVGCPIRNWCPTCYGMNYVVRGNPALRDHSMCHVYYALALVTSEYQMQMLMREPLDESRAGLLKFLLRIHREIQAKLDAIR